MDNRTNILWLFFALLTGLFLFGGCSGTVTCFHPPERGPARSLLLEEEIDGCKVTVGQIVRTNMKIDKDLQKHFNTIILFEVPKEDADRFILINLSATVKYKSYRTESKKVLIGIVKASVFGLSDMPDDIDSTTYCVVTGKEAEGLKYSFFPALSDIPVEDRMMPSWRQVEVIVVFYDIPEDESQIEYHLVAEYEYKSNAQVIDTTFTLVKGEYEVPYVFHW